VACKDEVVVACKLDHSNVFKDVIILILILARVYNELKVVGILKFFGNLHLKLA
jgi:hypothetical protein